MWLEVGDTSVGFQHMLGGVHGNHAQQLINSTLGQEMGIQTVNDYVNFLMDCLVSRTPANVVSSGGGYTYAYNFFY